MYNNILQEKVFHHINDIYEPYILIDLLDTSNIKYNNIKYIYFGKSIRLQIYLINFFNNIFLIKN